MSTPSYLEHDWFPAPVPNNVVIGPGSWVHSSYAFVHYRSRRRIGCRIGSNTGLYVGTTLDLGEDAELEVGDYSTLAGPVICTDGRVAIGSYSLISYLVTIADSAYAVPPFASGPDDRPPERRGARESVIEIGDNTWIGVGATILSGAVLNEGAVVGAATVVDFEVPPYAIVAGNPARVVGRTNILRGA